MPQPIFCPTCRYKIKIEASNSGENQNYYGLCEKCKTVIDYDFDPKKSVYIDRSYNIDGKELEKKHHLFLK